MIRFVGTYECALDAKGRLLIPALLKKQMESILSEGFVLKRSVFQPCLELYPMSEWLKVMNKLQGLNRFVKKNNDFIRIFTAGLKNIESDSNGRLQISKDLIDFASLTKNLVLSSSVNLIEIWDKQKYEKEINIEEAQFALLAEEIMGNNNENGIS